MNCWDCLSCRADDVKPGGILQQDSLVECYPSVQRPVGFTHRIFKRETSRKMTFLMNRGQDDYIGFFFFGNFVASYQIQI
jgi:hypothetical protein